MRWYYDRRRRIRRLVAVPWPVRGSGAPRLERGVERMVAVLDDLPPAQVLDAACGTGFLTRHLRGSVTGLDQSPAISAIAAERIPDARMVSGDAVPLPVRRRRVRADLHQPLLRPSPARRARGLRGGGAARGQELWWLTRPTAPADPARNGPSGSLSDGSRHRVYKLLVQRPRPRRGARRRHSAARGSLVRGGLGLAAATASSRI